MTLDHVVDTKAKRRCIFVLITELLVLKALFVYGMLASRLIALTTYSDVFALFDTTEISWTYLSRLVLSFLSSASMDLFGFIQKLCSAIRCESVITLLCITILLWSWRKVRPKLIIFLVVSFLCMVVLCGIMTIQGFQSQTLMEAVDILRIMGLMILLVCVAYGFLCLYGIVQVLFDYREALQVEVIELEEHAEKNIRE